MRIVIRIGGSVIASPINSLLISEYASLIKKLKMQGHELAVVVGGGALAREFIQLARDLGLPEEAQDEAAISASRILAEIIRKKLGKASFETVPLRVEDVVESLSEGKIAVMGGLRPGMTTDAVAALISEQAKVGLLVKATDQEGVYDRDPRKFPDAMKLDHIPIDELSDVFDDKKHKAGIHQILDPEAVKILKHARIRTIVVNGFKPENVLSAVNGKRIGTIID